MDNSEVSTENSNVSFREDPTALIGNFDFSAIQKADGFSALDYQSILEEIPVFESQSILEIPSLGNDSLVVNKTITLSPESEASIQKLMDIINPYFGGCDIKSTNPSELASNFFQLYNSGLEYRPTLVYGGNLSDSNYNFQVSDKKGIMGGFYYYYDYLTVDDVDDTMANVRLQDAVGPMRIVDVPLNMFIIDSKENLSDFFYTVKWFDTNASLADKVSQSEMWWGFRQKRYKRKRSFTFTPKLSYDPNTYKPVGEALYPFASAHRVLKSRQAFDVVNTSTNLLDSGYTRLFTKPSNSYLSPDISPEGSFSSLLGLSSKVKTLAPNIYDYYRAVRVAKQRAELLPITLARRLLRVNRTLVLPAHINITVITNSYDVVHS